MKPFFQSGSQVMDILQCTILVQDIHKNTPGKKVKGCLPFTSDSLYSLCFEQEYVLVQPTYKPNSDTSPSPTTCTRKIIRQDITDVDNFQHINLDSHEVAGYLICLPKVTKEEVLVLSQKTDRIVVVEGEEVVEFDHRDRMLVVFFLEEAEKYKGMSMYCSVCPCIVYSALIPLGFRKFRLRYTENHTFTKL